MGGELCLLKGRAENAIINCPILSPALCHSVIPLLAIDDNYSDAQLIAEHLRRADEGVYEITHTASLKDGLEYLESGEFAAVLLDLTLPDSDGLTTFERLHEHSPMVPTIVLTGRQDQSMALEAVRRGAQDYLVKDDLEPSYLARSIRYAIGRKEAHEEMVEALQEVALLERRVLEIGNQERMRISHNLHDSLGQTLAGTNFLAQGLLKRLQEADSDFVDLAEKIVEGIQESLTSVHNAVRGLVPVDNHEHGFHFATSELLRETQENFPIRCSVEPPAPIPIHDNLVATEMYLIVREAVHNSVKHAEASHIVVRFFSNEESLRVEIEDDGRGISYDNQAQSSSTRMGLRIMQYRANSIGAELAITSDEQQGTSVVLVCPTANLNRKDEQSDVDRPS